MGTGIEQEMLMSVDEFKRPQVKEGKDAIAILLLRLIQLEPGTFTSRPKMGVGILSNYRYCDESRLAELQAHIRDQIKTYLPEFQATKIITKLDSKGSLIIDIIVDEVLYRYETEEQNGNRIVGLRSIQ